MQPVPALLRVNISSAVPLQHITVLHLMALAGIDAGSVLLSHQSNRPLQLKALDYANAGLKPNSRAPFWSCFDSVFGLVGFLSWIVEAH